MTKLYLPNFLGKSTQEMAWQEVYITESDHYSPQERVSLLFLS